MVGMKNYLSCRFTDIPLWTPHSHAPLEVKRFLTSTYPVFITVSIDFLKVVRLVFWSGVVGPGSKARLVSKSTVSTVV